MSGRNGTGTLRAEAIAQTGNVVKPRMMYSGASVVQKCGLWSAKDA
jgi:hypothetical protein